MGAVHPAGTVIDAQDAQNSIADQMLKAPLIFGFVSRIRNDNANDGYGLLGWLRVLDLCRAAWVPSWAPSIHGVFHLEASREPASVRLNARPWGVQRKFENERGPFEPSLPPVGFLYEGGAA